ncbi:hypothetical protein [Streptomyces sp. NPDC004783]|uniref:hypothetical protein n=1 Tax=Streptomyces sp. NPDC004783 TaxID=3154459 RepID=UPI0033A5332A
MARDPIREIARLSNELKEIKKGQRYAHGGSLENSALEVKDDSGSLRAIVGVQGDGTTAVNIVNGPPPPTPTAPLLGAVFNGITVSWDGQFAGGAVVPLDWQRVEVHASPTDGFVPSLETLKTTFETPQGGTALVPCTGPVYVRLVARSTSGTPSEPTVQAGPLGPAPVVADDIVDGIVTTVKLAQDAVTAAKIAAGAVGTVALAEGAVLAEKLADNAVKVGKIDTDAVTGPAIAANAVTAGKIAADAVTAREIAAGAVTASEVAAGAITAEKLTVIGGSNLLSDPSFEGAYTAAQVAGLTYASQDTTMGNGSPTSIKINCVASTASTFQVPVTNIPVLPGDQLYLAVDYWVSADWNGTEINFQVRWEDAAGTRISFGKALTSTPVRETWTRMTATVPAPAQAANAKVRLESAGTTLGTVRFDNAAVRPVVGGTQIQDGAVTTQKIVAGAVQTAQLDAGAVNADKIAAGAVTTTKLDALAVTADKIAANAIVAGKIQAGAVDATALAADAITGKTITGGTVTGALIQTAASGERVVINESSNNKIRIYDTAGGLVGEFGSGGVGVKGSTGYALALNPTTTNPQVRWQNPDNTKVARAQVVVSGTGDLNLQLLNSTGTTVALEADRAYVSGAPLQVLPPATNLSACYVEAPAAHTGNLLRAVRDGDKFVVDKDGNATVTGTVTATGRVKPATGETGTVALQSGWTDYDAVNYNTARVRKTADGQAYLIGMIKAGTVTNGTLVATIPSGYWPLERHAFPRRSNQANVDVTIILSPNGELRIWDITGTLSTLSLAGMCWPLF